MRADPSIWLERTKSIDRELLCTIKIYDLLLHDIVKEIESSTCHCLCYFRRRHRHCDDVSLQMKSAFPMMLMKPYEHS